MGRMTVSIARLEGRSDEEALLEVRRELEVSCCEGLSPERVLFAKGEYYLYMSAYLSDDSEKTVDDWFRNPYVCNLNIPINEVA